ncbi:uncharacterized protein [Palaemon carinicauda]
MRSASLSLLAMAGGTGHLYVCHAPNTVFTSIIQLLSKYQLSMLLKLDCGGIAVLSPWAGSVGSLAVVSASGLATPPVMNKTGAQDSQVKHPSILKFVTQAAEKCLKSAPAHSSAEPEVTTRRFAAHYTEKWFKPLLACEDAVKKIVKKKATKVERLAMQERLQKKYRPQIPRALATGEIERLDLVDITQPPADPEPGVNTNPNMSRAQQLVKKSHIVTAQQKVKEQLAEEEERVQATERRAALASEQARKSQALESQVLNTVSDPQNAEELKQSLIALRQSNGGETDSYTTAQTIINLALMHIKNSGSVTVEDDLRNGLSDGVLQSAGEVSSTYTTAESRLSQYKLQTLLHLELLWLFGYSSCMLDGEELDSRRGNLREHHIEEAVKHLRAISLNHNPSTMASFLQETLLENYGETLGEVLVEIYEELNQPLPEELRILTGDISSVYDTRPSSVGSMMGPESNGTPDNPDSMKSREEKRLTRHPSLMEASKHRLVVPITNRALKRNESERTRMTSRSASKDTAENEFQKVRRNLFDLTDTAPKSKLRRCHTVDSVPVSLLRRSPRKKMKHSVEMSPLRTRGYKKTPVKAAATSSKGLQTPKLKKGGVLAPETPGDKIGKTIFNRKRICKSTGTTIVTESPDIKRACRTTPRKLHASLTITRRNSFYSGGRSRNWERAKTQLLADRIRGKSGQRSIDQNSFQNTNASQLFTEILSNGIDDLGDNTTNLLTETPLRRTLSFGCDDTESERSEKASFADQNHNGSINGKLHAESPARNTRAADKVRVQHNLSLGLESRTTPVKNVRRTLSLSTPSKSFRITDESNVRSATILQGINTSPDSASKQGVTSRFPETPKRFNANLSEMTPSKRVQFSLTLTPSKAPVSNHFQTPRSKCRPLLETPVTPRSILKTPKKSTNETPSKANFLSPDIFASSKKGPQSPVTTPMKSASFSVHAPGMEGPSDLSNRSTDSPFSGFSDKVMATSQNVTPVKFDKTLNATPLKINRYQNGTPVRVDQNKSMTPIKVVNIACYEESEVELVSPLKSNHESSKACLILHNTPTKKHHMGDVLDLKPCKLSFENEDDDCGADVENSVNLDQEAVGSAELPQMEATDVEFINSLMFGSDFEQNLSVSSAVFEGFDEDTEFVNSTNLIPSPLKYVMESSEVGDSQSWVSLPDKQECPDDVDFKRKPTIDRNTGLLGSPTEIIEISPKSEDKTILPSLDNILNQHLIHNTDNGHDDLQADFPTTSNGTVDYCLSECTVPLIDVLKVTEMEQSPSDSVTEMEQSPLASITEIEQSLSESPEIPLDYEQLSRYLGKTSVLDKETEVPKSSDISDEPMKLTKANSNADIAVKRNSTGRNCQNRRMSNSRTAKRKLPLEDSDDSEKIFDSSSFVAKYPKRKTSKICNDTKVKSKVLRSAVKPAEDEEEFAILQAEIQQLDSNLDRGDGSFLHKSSQRMRYASSTPVNGNSHKRRMLSSDEDCEADNQENNQRKKRPKRRASRRMIEKEGRKSERVCKIKRSSLKEISSDDENFECYEINSLSKVNGRIFDDDSDFESPGKALKLSGSKMLPLKNLENLCNRDIVTDNYTGDNEVSLSESSKGHSSFGTPKTPCGKNRPQRIDKYLSSVQKRKRSSINVLPEHETVGERRPARSRGIVTDVKNVKSSIESFSGTDSFVNKIAYNGVLETKKRKRKKGVKLKLTKSGNNYEVSNVDVSLESSDRNSSSADSQIVRVDTKTSNSPSSVTESATPFDKKRKKSTESHCMITPLRFTRHMSKDLSISPELFSQLIALSPEKKSQGEDTEEQKDITVPVKEVNDIKKRKRDLLRHFNEKRSAESSNSQTAQLQKDVISSEWTVQSIPGSPTLKTFIRKQKKRYAVDSSPRVELSPLRDYNTDQPLKEPTYLSLLHLSVSPIISKKERLAADKSLHDMTKSKRFRRLYKGNRKNLD